MKNKSLISIFILLFFISIILIGTIIAIIYIVNQPKEVPINLPSKCYTNLQPSPFLNQQGVSPFTENQDNDYVKIEIKDREFYTRQVSVTGSMRPTIPDFADVLFIKPTISDLQIGDIVSFNCNSEIILHRIVNISNNIYTTKGDNNAINDLTGFGCRPKFEDITGKVVGVLY